jgi:hypothetical protein
VVFALSLRAHFFELGGSHGWAKYQTMRLYEFTKEPPVKAVLKDYIQKGYKRIGEPSASAAVFAPPDRREVIKIGKSSDCWLNFAEVAKGSNNPHVPKIKSLEMYGPHYLAVIEHLSEVPETFFKTPMFRKIAAWLYTMGNWVNGKDVYLHSASRDTINQLVTALANEHPAMVDALKLIVKARGNCNYDCHPENLMKRSDGTLVFSDPLTHQG